MHMTTSQNGFGFGINDSGSAALTNNQAKYSVLWNYLIDIH